MMYQDVQRGSVHGPYTAGYTGPGGFGGYGNYGGLGSYGADPSGFMALMERRGMPVKPQLARIPSAEGRSRTVVGARPDLPMSQVLQTGRGSSAFVDGSLPATGLVGELVEGATAAVAAGSWWPWILGGTAVAAIGGGIYYATRKKKRSKP